MVELPFSVTIIFGSVSKYFMFNGEFVDPEDPLTISYFTGGTGNYGPTPIDFKLDTNKLYL